MSVFEENSIKPTDGLIFHVPMHCLLFIDYYADIRHTYCLFRMQTSAHSVTPEAYLDLYRDLGGTNEITKPLYSGFMIEYL
jgi:hypothetical protein